MNNNPLISKQVVYFEPNHSNLLDDDYNFCNVRGGGGGGGGRGGFGGGFGGGAGRPMGGGRVSPPRVAPAVAPRVVAPAVAPRVAPAVAPAVAPTARTPRTPQQRHTAMVRRFYNRYPYGGNFGHRRFGFTPYGRRWWLGGGSFLYGYPFEFWYPFFYDLDLGIYDEYYLRQKYNLTDEQWNELITKLINGNYISFNY